MNDFSLLIVLYAVLVPTFCVVKPWKGF